jgi:hypothetical protein
MEEDRSDSCLESNCENTEREGLQRTLFHRVNGVVPPSIHVVGALRTYAIINPRAPADNSEILASLF